jgi:glycosyltransferase involved in cell wall biosynthesis
MNGKKKLLFITHSSQSAGGAENGFDEIIEYFYSKRDMYEIWIIFPEGERSIKYKGLCDRAIQYNRCFLPVTRRPIKEYLYFLRSFIEIKKLFNEHLKDQKFDACFINVVVLFWFVHFVKKVTSNINVMVRETIYPDFIRKFVYKYYKKNVRNMLFVSKSNMDDYVNISNKCSNNYLFYTRIKININNEINPNFEDLYGKKIAESLTSEKLKIICSGSICNRKNQLLILKAIKVLKERGLQLPLIFFVGDNTDDPEYKKILDGYIKENGISDYVTFMGLLQGIKYETIFKAMDVFVLSSISEGLPLVLIEALGFKKAVISTDVGGIKDIIRNDVSGLFVSNKYELSEAIELLSCNTEKRNQLAKEGFKIYVDYIINQEKSLNMLEDIMNEI